MITIIMHTNSQLHMACMAFRKMCLANNSLSHERGLQCFYNVQYFELINGIVGMMMSLLDVGFLRRKFNFQIREI